jgi:uncharacterized membrane protein YdbT with pleckstrin-like domain
MGQWNHRKKGSILFPSELAIIISMFKLEDVLQIKDHEQIRMVAKRHTVTVLPMLLLAFVLIVAPFFFLFPLFSTGPAGIVVFLVLILAGLIVAWRTFAVWDGSAFIVSDARVVRAAQTGIFSRTVNEAALRNVSEVSWEKKGIFGYVFNYGNLNVGGAEKIEVRHIPRPRELHALIQEVADAAKKLELDGERERKTRLESVKKMIEGMDADDLRKIERALKQDDRAGAADAFFAPDEDKEKEREITVKKLFGSDGDSNKLKPLDDHED